MNGNKRMYDASDLSVILGVSKNTARKFLVKVAESQKPFQVLNFRPITTPAKQFDEYFGEETLSDICCVYDSVYIARCLGRTVIQTDRLFRKMILEEEPCFKVLKINNQFRIPKKSFSAFIGVEVDWNYRPDNGRKGGLRGRRHE